MVALFSAISGNLFFLFAKKPERSDGVPNAGKKGDFFSLGLNRISLFPGDREAACPGEPGKRKLD
ncbi:MAG: hypothetical protein ACOVNV_06375 [Pirellulaceae bacterium]